MRVRNKSIGKKISGKILLEKSDGFLTNFLTIITVKKFFGEKKVITSFFVCEIFPVKVYRIRLDISNCSVVTPANLFLC